MPLDDIGDWVQAHKVPAALIGGTGLALTFALFARRGGKKAPAATLPNGWTVGALTAPTGSTMVTGPYDPNLYLPYLTGDPGGSSSPVVATPDPSVPTVVHTPPPPTPTPVAPVPTNMPIALPQLANAIIVSNPSGSADALASSSYTPSMSDYLSERIGGITRQTVALQGGGTYTVDNTNVGSGPVVPLSQRVKDERYDSTGRVIY